MFGKILFRVKTLPEYFFAVFALIFGVVFIVVTPPFQAPDEAAHFLRSYQVSDFNFVVDEVDGKAGGRLPEAVHRTIQITALNPSMEFRPDIKYNISKTKEALLIKDTGKEITLDFSNTAAYAPVSYLPQSIGMLIGKIFGVPPLVLLYLGRFANLVAWIACIVLSIRLIPRKKWVLAAIGLLPMAVFQASSLSTDVMATGMAAVFFSLVLFYLNRQKVLAVKEIGLILLAGIILALSKQVMFVLLPLVLLLANSLFKNKKQAYIVKFGLILIPLLCAGLWLYLVKDINIASTLTNGQNQAAQLSFIIHAPWSFINTLWNTYFFTWGDEIGRSLIGNFGWVDTPLSMFWVVFGYVELILLLLMGYELKQWLSKRQKIIVAACFVLYWLAVNAALYVFYSPVGYKIIVGLQGRYFIPLLILLIPLFYNKVFKLNKTIYLQIAKTFPLILLIASAITIYFRYYINNV